MKNLNLSSRTIADIDTQVAKVLRGLGNPEPPLDLRLVRELLKLDQGYYSVTDDSLLRETFSRMKVAGLQVLQRPTLLKEAVKTLSLKALYLPDQKRILLDKDLPKLKHRWNEAHEIGHDIVPWHAGMMFGDTEQTLTPSCHAIMEGEANYAAGQLLFLGSHFVVQATSEEPSIALIRSLSKKFGNTLTSTLWRFTEEAHGSRPMVALVTGHPNLSKRKLDFDPAKPCRYFIQSPTFQSKFGTIEEGDLFEKVARYAGRQRGGPLGGDDVVLADSNGDTHLFRFETFFNGYEAITLGYCLRRHQVVVPLNGFRRI